MYAHAPGGLAEEPQPVRADGDLSSGFVRSRHHRYHARASICVNQPRAVPTHTAPPPALMLDGRNRRSLRKTGLGSVNEMPCEDRFGSPGPSRSWQPRATRRECESFGIRDSESLDYLAAAAVDPDQLPGALRALI